MRALAGAGTRAQLQPSEPSRRGLQPQPPRVFGRTGGRGGKPAPPAATLGGAAAQEQLADVAKRALQSGGFVLEKAQVNDLVARLGLDEETLLLQLIQPAKEFARPPISGFRVGAVALGASGRAFFGVNLEFEGVPLSQSVHAEQCAVARAANERHLVALATSAAPCGHCRQFLQELARAGELRTVMPQRHEVELTQLLPDAFGPDDLLGRSHAFLLSQRHNFLQWAPSALEALRGQPAAAVELATRARTAAQAAYAPYTREPSGVALRTRSGAVYAGGCLESAAYNPTLPPLQAALVAAAAGGLPSWSEISEAVLVQVAGAKVSQADVTQLMLSRLAPGTQLRVLLVEGVLPGEQVMTPEAYMASLGARR